MRRAWFALLLVACGSSPTDRLCAQAVDHVFALTMQGPPGSEPKADEAAVIGSIKDATLRQCRSEGLSREQADCILATHAPDWDDQLRACPAYAAKPASWVIVRPTRDQRRALHDKPPIPDGPRETRTHYRQLVALAGSTCGLTEAGAVQCWGDPLEAPFPAGTFVQIVTSGAIACGRSATGLLSCTLRDSMLTGRIPSDVAYNDFALDHWGGCGVRASDKQIECWSIYDNEPPSPPLAQFTSVVVNHTGACGRTVDGGEACFGTDPPVLPRAELLAWSESLDGSCSVGAARHLTCTNAWRLGPAPVGEFDTVATSGAHACATRHGGGTVCWGENDDGQCNVPQ